MNRTERNVNGGLARARKIAQQRWQASQPKPLTPAQVASKVHAASVKPKGPARDARGRFVKVSK